MHIHSFILIFSPHLDNMIAWYPYLLLIHRIEFRLLTATFRAERRQCRSVPVTFDARLSISIMGWIYKAFELFWSISVDLRHIFPETTYISHTCAPTETLKELALCMPIRHWGSISVKSYLLKCKKGRSLWAEMLTGRKPVPIHLSLPSFPFTSQLLVLSQRGEM